MGRVIALYSETGGGKTTQIGELAKEVFKERKEETLLFGSDLGGHGPLAPLVNLGVIRAQDYAPETDDAWSWIANAVSLPEEALKGVGLIAYDSGTAMGEALLLSCAQLSAGGEDIGGRPAPKFVINKGKKTQLKVGSNVDSHYMVVQSFMREMIWRSTWLARKGPDVLWTFGLYRGENAEASPVYGPQLAGKALTPLMPKWFNYTFPLVKIAVAGQATRHLLYLQEQPDPTGLATYFANARYPLDSSIPLPVVVEPASLPEALRLVEGGAVSAQEALALELGLSSSHSR